MLKAKIMAAVIGLTAMAFVGSANAAAIITESFEGTLQTETVIIGGGNGGVGQGNNNFWSVLPTGSLNINYNVVGVHESSFFGGRDDNFLIGTKRGLEYVVVVDQVGHVSEADVDLVGDADREAVQCDPHGVVGSHRQLVVMTLALAQQAYLWDAEL